MDRPTSRYLVFRSREARNYLCVCEARDGGHALTIARRLFRLTRTAHAVKERVDV